MSKALKTRYDATNVRGEYNKTEGDVFEKANKNNRLTLNSVDTNQLNYNILMIPLSEIAFHPNNQYAQVSIPALAKSIRGTNGLINPINIARIEDLAEDSKIKKGLNDSGVDLTGCKYVIFDGERRFRAYTLLLEEEKAAGKDGHPEDYKCIPANLLTAEQARNEEQYHNDSNLFARQLTESEIIINIIDVFDRVVTDEDKRAAMVYMKEGKEDGINPDPQKAAKRFHSNEYCSYYLKKEIGLDISPAKCKKVLALYNNGIKELLDAVIARTFPQEDAYHLEIFPADVQKRLLKVYFEKGRKEYLKELKEEEQILNKDKSQRKSNKDQIKNINALKDHITKDAEKILNTSEWLGKKDQETTRRLIKKVTELVEEIESAISKLE